jgi:hypothetical protein
MTFGSRVFSLSVSSAVVVGGVFIVVAVSVMTFSQLIASRSD